MTCKLYKVTTFRNSQWLGEGYHPWLHTSWYTDLCAAMNSKHGGKYNTLVVLEVDVDLDKVALASTEVLNKQDNSIIIDDTTFYEKVYPSVKGFNRYPYEQLSKETEKN